MGTSGGALVVSSVSGAVTITDSDFERNSGGPVSGLAVSVSAYAQPVTIQGSRFVNNIGGFPGTVRFALLGSLPGGVGPATRVEDSRFVDNVGNGIVYHGTNGHEVVERTTIVGSTTPADVIDLVVPSAAGVVDHSGARPGSLTIANSTIADN